MIAAVLDTNVLASGFLGLARPASPPGEILRRWQDGVFSLVVSEHILAELARTFSDRYFTRRLSLAQTTEAISALRSDALVQPISITVHGVATRPKDDLVLATALSAGVDYLITGDRPFQSLGSYRGVTILSPRQFLELLDAVTP